MDKKKQQLGMNPSTASGRLVKDILYDRVVKHEVCHHCEKPMDRDSFSIEHKEPWLDSDDPVGNYFNQDNITFSHLSCNAAASRGPGRKHGKSRYNYGCRCDICRAAKAKHSKRYIDKHSRQVAEQVQASG